MATSGRNSQLAQNDVFSIFQALTHAVIAVSKLGTILEANNAALQLLGYTRVGAGRMLYLYLTL